MTTSTQAASASALAFSAAAGEIRLTRAQALELMELFLLGFRHGDYYTGHARFTPGSQTSLGA